MVQNKQCKRIISLVLSPALIVGLSGCVYTGREPLDVATPSRIMANRAEQERIDDEIEAQHPGMRKAVKSIQKEIRQEEARLK
jgi:hypothetical protein